MPVRFEEDRVKKTVDLIYEAAVDSARWHDSVNNICDLFGASRTCFAQFDTKSRSFEHVSTERDPEAVRQLKQFQHNIMLDTVSAAPLGEIYNDQVKIGFSQLKQSAFWNDWARPRDMFGSLTVKIHVDGPTFWFLDLQRGRNSPTFDEHDASLLSALVPHVLRAGRLSHTFQARQSLGSVFQSLPFGLVIVDRNRTVLAQNAAATAIVEGHQSVLRIRSGCLTASDPTHDARLSMLVASACTPSAQQLRHSGGDMLLSTGGNGGAPTSFALSVGPLNSTTMFGTSFQSCSAVFIKEVSLVLSEQFELYLQANFNLSPSEARLATALANGKSLKDISKETGLQVKTARTYLDRVFAKTGTHQQSQLVALLRSSVPFRLY